MFAFVKYFYYANQVSIQVEESMKLDKLIICCWRLSHYPGAAIFEIHALSLLPSGWNHWVSVVPNICQFRTFNWHISFMIKQCMLRVNYRNAYQTSEWSTTTIFGMDYNVAQRFSGAECRLLMIISSNYISYAFKICKGIAVPCPKKFLSFRILLVLIGNSSNRNAIVCYTNNLTVTKWMYWHWI